MKKYNYEITENTAKNRLYGIFNDNETIARDEINSLQTYFRSIHIQTQFVIIIIAFCFEFSYYFIFQNQMALPFSEYSLKYIIPPTTRRHGAREKKKETVLNKIRNIVEIFVGI